MVHFFNKRCFISSLSYLLVGAAFSHGSLFAAPQLWEAIEAYERHDLDRAAQLFRPYTRGNPIARPYIVDLNREGVLRDEPQPKDLSNHPQDIVAQGWYRTSSSLKKFQRSLRDSDRPRNRKAKEKLKERTLARFKAEMESSQHPSSHYSVAKLFEDAVDLAKRPSIGKEVQRLYFPSVAGKGVLELRGLMALKRLGAPLKLGLVQKIPIFERLLEAHDVGEALYRFAPLFRENQNFWEVLVRTAAFHGSGDAQFLMAQRLSADEDEAYYWLEHASAHGNAKAWGILATFLEHGMGCQQDLPRSFILSTRAVEGNVDHNPEFYRNHAIRLLNGIGTPADSEQAEVYFKMAVDYGEEPDIVQKYGECLEANGRILAALQFWRDRAEQGDLDSIFQIVMRSSDPAQYADLIPICLRLAETNDSALRLAYFMVYNMGVRCPEIHQNENTETLYRLFGRLEKDTNEHQDFAFYSKAMLLKWLNAENNLQGNFIDLLERSAALGNPNAFFELGQSYDPVIQSAQETEGDLERALDYYQKALAGGIEEAHEKIGCLLMNQHNPQLDGQALHHLRKAYNLHTDLHAYVAHNLGIMHRDGRGGAEPDPVLIKNYFLEAMDHPAIRLDAKYELVVSMCSAMESPEFSGDVRELLEESALQGHGPSLFLKGQLLLLEAKSAADNKQGLQDILTAVERDVPYAKAYYAVLLLFGIPDLLEQDVARAKDLFSEVSPQELQRSLLFMEGLHSRRNASLGKGVEDIDGEESQEARAEVNDEALMRAGKQEDTSAVIHEQGKAAKTNPTLERLFREIEKLQGKKKVKWHKMKGLMKRFMAATSGDFKPGKGSGHRVEMGGYVTGLHIPHGKDAAEISGGRLESMLELMRQVQVDMGYGAGLLGSESVESDDNCTVRQALPIDPDEANSHSAAAAASSRKGKNQKRRKG